jgi:flagellar basal-body rod modification protein FlgD
MSAAYSANPMNNAVMGGNKVPNETVKNKKELGQDEFMKLMLTQLKAQDPLNPQSNADFIAQMAQFSQLDGMTKLNDSFDKMTDSMRSSQALQASAMVGHKVQVPANTLSYRENQNVTGSVVLPDKASDVKVSVINDKNELMTQLSLGSYGAGAVPFTWNGLDSHGNKVPEGTYHVIGSGILHGQRKEVGTLLEFNVDSVSVGAGQVFLNLEGHGSVDLSQAKKIS